jgi:ElaB/YqjD/DUF883 family membrane-anchored ribosome-binding protein
MASEAKEIVRTEEIEALKKDMRRIRDDLKEICKTAGIYSESKLEGYKEQIGEMLENIKSKGGQYFAETYKTAKEKSCEAMEKSRDVVKENPLTSILAAFTAGVLFGVLIKRR